MTFPGGSHATEPAVRRADRDILLMRAIAMARLEQLGLPPHDVQRPHLVQDE